MDPLDLLWSQWGKQCWKWSWFISHYVVCIHHQEPSNSSSFLVPVHLFRVALRSRYRASRDWRVRAALRPGGWIRPPRWMSMWRGSLSVKGGLGDGGTRSGDADMNAQSPWRGGEEVGHGGVEHHAVWVRDGGGGHAVLDRPRGRLPHETPAIAPQPQAVDKALRLFPRADEQHGGKEGCRAATHHGLFLYHQHKLSSKAGLHHHPVPRVWHVDVANKEDDLLTFPIRDGLVGLNQMGNYTSQNPLPLAGWAAGASARLGLWALLLVCVHQLCVMLWLDAAHSDALLEREIQMKRMTGWRGRRWEVGWRDTRGKRKKKRRVLQELGNRGEQENNEKKKPMRIKKWICSRKWGNHYKKGEKEGLGGVGGSEGWIKERKKGQEQRKMGDGGGVRGSVKNVRWNEIGGGGGEGGQDKKQSLVKRAQGDNSSHFRWRGWCPNADSIIHLTCLFQVRKHRVLMEVCFWLRVCRCVCSCLCVCAYCMSLCVCVCSCLCACILHVLVCVCVCVCVLVFLHICLGGWVFFPRLVCTRANHLKMNWGTHTMELSPWLSRGQYWLRSLWLEHFQNLHNTLLYVPAYTISIADESAH